jgi:ABC-type lipoprotein release transport system permease subunit
VNWGTIVRQAIRSSRRHTRRTVISAVAVAFGFGLTIFFIGFGDGIYNQLIDDAARLQAGHLTIQHTGYLEAPALDLHVADARSLADRLNELEGVAVSKRLVNAQGMARSGVEATGVGIMGLEPAIERDLSPVADHIVAGEYLRDDDDRWVLIGVDMAERLDLAPGKKLVVSANDANGDLVESLFRVRGVFRSGEPGLDGYVVQMPIDAAAGFFGLPAGAATDLGIVLAHRTDRTRVTRAAQALVEGHAELVLLGWEDVQPGLAAYIRTDRGGNIVFTTILVALTLFTIFNTLLMSVLERRREFAVQMAIGVSSLELGMQIVGEALILAALGCALGSVLGWVPLWYFMQNGIDLASLMGGHDDMTLGNFAVSTVVHPDLAWSSYAAVVRNITLATLFTAIVPMRLIGQMQLARELRA